MSETFTLQTTLGPLSIQFTDAKHAYLSTDRVCYVFGGAISGISGISGNDTENA